MSSRKERSKEQPDFASMSRQELLDYLESIDGKRAIRKGISLSHVSKAMHEAMEKRKNQKRA